MNRIFKKPTGKSCLSCSTGKKCSGCKKQKSIKPVVYIEEPRRLPTSIVISRLTNKQRKREINAKPINKLKTEDKKKVEKLNKLNSEEEKRLLKQRKRDEKLEKNLKKEQQAPTAPSAKKKLPSLRSWYRQRTALIRLEHERRKERKAKEKEKANEAIHVLEEAKARAKKARRTLKEREATAKPHAHSKYASVKHTTNKTLTYRFVNFCNKLCCQCYCYFSIIFVLGFLFIYFI